MMDADQNRKDRGFIRGVVLYTIFQNESENFSIIKMKIEETNEAFDEKEIFILKYCI